MQEQMSGGLKVVILVVGVVVFAGAVFFFNKESVQDTPVVEEQPATTQGPAGETAGGPLTPPEGTPTQNDVPEPEPLPEDIQKQINAITAKVDSGEITIEEAQEQVNKLLGL